MRQNYETKTQVVINHCSSVIKMKSRFTSLNSPVVFFFCSAGSDMAIFCLLCGKRFQTQTALQQHMEVHAGVRSYICSECNRTFPSHTALKRHLRSHTGKREQLGNRLHYTAVRSLTLVCCRAAIKTITGKCVVASVWGKENNGHD